MINGIRYENRLDDFTALSEHSGKEQTGWTKYLYDWAFPLGVFVVFFFQTERPLVVRIVSGIISAILVRPLIISAVGRWIAYALAWIQSRMKKGVTGEHELTITEDALIETTPHNRTEVPWSKVGPVMSVGPYTAITVKLFMAHLVPNERILEGELEPFLEEVRRRAEIK